MVQSLKEIVEIPDEILEVEDTPGNILKQITPIDEEMAVRLIISLNIRYFSLDAICKQVNKSKKFVIETIKTYRKEAKALYEDENDSLRAEMIEALKQQLRRAETLFEQDHIKASIKANLIGTMVKINVAISDMLGVNKQVEIEGLKGILHKLYTTSPNLPEAKPVEKINETL